MIKPNFTHFVSTFIGGILTCVFLLLLSPSHACAAEPQLTPDQQAILQAILKESPAAAAALAQPPKAEAAVDVAAKWAELGKSIGVGMVSAAKEIGVAANQFIQTDVGKITAAVIIWKFMGEDAIRLMDWIIDKVSGAILVFVVAPMCLRKAWGVGQKVERTVLPKSLVWGMVTYNSVTSVDRGRLSSLTESQQFLTGMYAIAALVFGVVGLINLF